MAETGAGGGPGITITPTDPSNTSFSYKINTVEERTWIPGFISTPFREAESR